jgi:alcohol dehydrogenase
LQLPTLSTWGVRASDFRRIVDHSRGSSMKTNPVALNDEEIERILRQRLD